ncbi:uncharacterized protein LOC113679340 isoform X2 [Pocillopora damicornis]|uniref:uncharacterized protein LOC113679340 isoform X2 n=1 Tax=Pocillopora damicornis TaxID=46731 RepID=UPI000F5570BD|nr:uncharacterized protein LOC113679340 isoform X2 [Pocillopora damicornis]
MTLRDFCMSERIFPTVLFFSISLSLFEVSQGSVEGSALSVDHVISVHVTESPGDCELKCYLEDDCMSINTGPMGDGTYYCELNDSDHVLHPRDLENRIGVIYRSVKNFCASSPCSSNERCQTGFTDKGYRCICSAEFKGENCSIGKEK